MANCMGVPAGITAIPAAPAAAPRERSAAIRSGIHPGTRDEGATRGDLCGGWDTPTIPWHTHRGAGLLRP